jgi:hypothetical protein
MTLGEGITAAVSPGPSQPVYVVLVPPQLPSSDTLSVAISLTTGMRVTIDVYIVRSKIQFCPTVPAMCARFPPRDGMKRVRECVYRAELDLQTLIWTRGDFPLTMLESRLKCPRCGSRRVRVAFTVPPSSQPLRA